MSEPQGSMSRFGHGPPPVHLEHHQAGPDRDRLRLLPRPPAATQHRRRRAAADRVRPARRCRARLTPPTPSSPTTSGWSTRYRSGEPFEPQDDHLVAAVLPPRLLRRHAHAAAVRRPLRARARGRAPTSTATTSAPGRSPRCAPRSARRSRRLPARRSPRPRSGPSDLPPCDAAIATLWSSAYPILRMRQARAKFYFVQDNEPQFYAGRLGVGAGRGDLPLRAAGDRQHARARRGLSRPTATRPCRSCPRSTCSATTRRRSRATRAPRCACSSTRGRARRATRSGSASRRWPTLKRGSRRARRDHLRRRELEPGAVRPHRPDPQPRRARLARRGRGAVSQLRHRAGVHAHQAPELSAVRVHGLRDGDRLEHQPGHHAGCCATARTACSRRRFRPRPRSGSGGWSTDPRAARADLDGRARGGRAATAGTSRSSASGARSACRTTAFALTPWPSRRSTSVADLSRRRLELLGDPRRLAVEDPEAEHPDHDDQPRSAPAARPRRPCMSPG